jgi:UDP-2-acetamido-2,6-beta-L-arabino-hexul-4-ose reductase
MIKIGITGQTGFIGTHLYNFLGLKKDEITRIPFQDQYFEDIDKLNEFVGQCDVIVHLAALNRHNEPEFIYKTNISLVEKLIVALETTGSKAQILFASSTQEERDNPFGKSKKEGREILARWADKNHSIFTGIVIPNVFGPFGNPYYNSVVATFCHQVNHLEQPKIEVDAQLNLIYIGELILKIYDAIINKIDEKEYRIQHTAEKKVSELLLMINNFKNTYTDLGIFPDLKNNFEINLFNTFRTYMNIPEYFPVKFIRNTDDRGSFVETIKSYLGGQVSFSTTKPGITRGNHFHTRKIERFAVIKGKALIQIRRIGTQEVYNFELNGNEPAYVDMPIWYTHNITNIGEDDLYTIFWINEFFDPQDPDTFYEEV